MFDDYKPLSLYRGRRALCLFTVYRYLLNFEKRRWLNTAHSAAAAADSLCRPTYLLSSFIHSSICRHTNRRQRRYSLLSWVDLPLGTGTHCRLRRNSLSTYDRHCMWTKWPLTSHLDIRHDDRIWIKLQMKLTKLSMTQRLGFWIFVRASHGYRNLHIG